MAHMNYDAVYSIPAKVDLTGNQYCFINAANTSGQAEAAKPTAGGRVIGILENPDAKLRSAGGEPARYARAGVLKLKLGTGGATAGANLCADAEGKGVVSATTGHLAYAIALETGVAGDIIKVEVPGGIVAIIP